VAPLHQVPVLGLTMTGELRWWFQLDPDLVAGFESRCDLQPAC
jgi:hypothetical protein